MLLTYIVLLVWFRVYTLGSRSRVGFLGMGSVGGGRFVFLFLFTFASIPVWFLGTFLGCFVSFVSWLYQSQRSLSRVSWLHMGSSANFTLKGRKFLLA